ncbi:MAG TPA: methyltransferase domain-containing protein [Kofleriaceae bacterium]|nr:methyltransferase domain-containing protein [Kofleriaceae bacterium]
MRVLVVSLLLVSIASAAPCPEDNRDKSQKPDHIVQLAELTDGMTVVDLGSGTGYLLCRLSSAVGASGHVIATEVSKPLVKKLAKRAAREQLANVEAVKAPAKDVGVAAGTADRIVILHVWHHLPDRRQYAARIAQALAPGGKVVIVDFEKASKHATHGIAAKRVLAELAAGGIDAKLVPDEIANDYVIIGVAASPSPSSSVSPSP